MYLAVCDDQGRKIKQIPLLSLFDVRWVMSPATNEGDDYSIINASLIKFMPFHGWRCWAASMGVAHEVDGKFFLVCPLEHGYELRQGESLALAPGQLRFSASNTRPSGRQVPEPDPLSLRMSKTNELSDLR